MGILRHRQVKAGLGIMLVGLVAVIALVIARDSPVVAKGFGGYDQVSSAGALKEARGIVDALAQTNNGERLITGEWTLKCGGPCAASKLYNIEFDMAIGMRKLDGGGRHSHQFSAFSATSTTLDGDDLTIEGIITGSNEIGTDEVTIRLVAIVPDGNASFFLELGEGNAIHSELGGAIVESN